jgi:hypothetical protein
MWVADIREQNIDKDKWTNKNNDQPNFKIIVSTPF